MKDLQFETGLVSYSLNGKIEVTFNPTDAAFVETLFNAFSELDRRQEEYKTIVESSTDNKAVFEAARKADADMRETINTVFGTDVCTPLFGGMNVYAMAGGLPAWANLLLAVMDEIDTGFAREQKATNPRLEKYLKKYQT